MSAGFGLRQLGQPEIQDLDSPIFREEQILRLEVAMNDPFFVRRGQSMGDLQGIVHSLARRDRSAAQALAQGLSLKQFGHHVRRALACAKVECCQNVGMVQGSGGQGFLLKTAQPVGVKRKALRQALIATSRLRRESRAR